MLSCPNQKLLQDFVQGQLADPEIGSLAEHLVHCEPCLQTLSSLKVHDTLVDLVHSLKGNIMVGQKNPEVEAVVQRVCGLLKPAAAHPESTPQDYETFKNPGPPFQAPISLCPAIPGYEILGCLGEGGMGTVFKARHRHLGKLMALKLLPPRDQISPWALARFHQEMQAVGQLNHAHIVQAHDAGETAGGLPYLAMEYLEGIDLAKLVKQHGPLSVADACEVIRQAALGLQHAHEHGLVHRDLKPSNLLLTTSGVLKILDLGLARLREGPVLGEAATVAGLTMGTPDYLAPEQWLNAHEVDIRADLYGLGCTLYHLLTGKPPFEGYDMQRKKKAHLLEKPTPIRTHRPDVPAALAGVLDRLLAKDPAQRPLVPAEVAEALRPFAAGASLTRLLPDTPWRKPQTAPDRASTLKQQPAGESKRRRRFQVRAVAAALLLGLGLLAAAVFYVVTDRGTLVVESNDPDVEVLVKQEGKTVVIIDKKTGKEITLRSGAYELELQGGKPGLTLSTDRFVLKRGDKEIVRVLLAGKPPPKVALVNKSMGSATITFAGLDASKGAVSGETLAKYLDKFGVQITAVTAGTQVSVMVNKNVEPSTVLVQNGPSEPLSFTISLATPVDSFSFTRPKLLATTASGTTHPEWKAAAFDAQGKKLDSVGEELLGSFKDVPAATFTLKGPGITSVRFDSDGKKFAAYSGVLLADFVLKRTASPPPPGPAWVKKKPLPEAASGQMAEVLDGVLYVAGGVASATKFLDTLHRYNPGLDRWETRAALPQTKSGDTGRTQGAFTALNGKLYLVGGHCTNSRDHPSGLTKTLLIYNPADNLWKIGPMLPKPSGHSVAGAIAGKLYYLECVEYGLHKLFLVFDPDTGKWSNRTAPPLQLDYRSGAVIDGKLYVVGGQAADGQRTGALYVYNPATDKWTAKAPMPTARSQAAAAVLDGKLYVLGGHDSNKVLDTVECYDPANDRWSALPPLPTPRYFLGAAVVGRTIYALGGQDGGENRLAVVEALTIPATEK